MQSVALIGCVIAILSWGSAGIFDKLAMKDIDPFSGVLVRMVLITTAVLVFCAATDRLRPVLEFEPRTYLYLIVSGLLGGLIGQLAYYIAIKHAPVTVVVPVTATYPVIAFVLAAIFLREQLTLPKVGGLILVVVGLMLLSSGKNNASQAEETVTEGVVAEGQAGQPAREAEAPGRAEQG